MNAREDRPAKAKLTGAKPPWNTKLPRTRGKARILSEHRTFEWSLGESNP